MEHVNADQVREALLLDEELRAQAELYIDPEIIEAFLMGKYGDPDHGWEAVTVTKEG